MKTCRKKTVTTDPKQSNMDNINTGQAEAESQ